eukprot:gnl/TRDRNA2_/TRDRNA2_72016_c0_seq2.p1 gnl/TRDRNA2_/TRDRNA2_72016_c0~~gnl/TRDRNA2_/TRDRNA2_72016_c0_seq2.p1  ORF type:complete len:324 (+),score=35.46 gnl/TRDRNA2_/TRDRNA2_72016_c0_seq2:90-1061(+)
MRRFAHPAQLPHIARDLRLLWRVLVRPASQPLAASAMLSKEPPPPGPKLLEPVRQRVDDLAAEALDLLCLEAAAAAAANAVHGSRPLPALDLISSPAAIGTRAPLGICTLDHIEAGRLLCFYPGRIFSLEEPELPMSDQMLVNEYDRSFLDGKGWLPWQWHGHPLLARHNGPCRWHGNRLAVANFLNHPPPGVLPNCVPIAFRWPTWQELGKPSAAKWAELIPHVEILGGEVIRTVHGGLASGNPPTDEHKEIVCTSWPRLGMAFVAVRPILPGAELFWNYRLHPRADADVSAGVFPSWYTPVDEAEFEAAVEKEADGAIVDS